MNVLQIKEKREEAKLNIRRSKLDLPKLTKRLTFTEEKVNHLVRLSDNFAYQKQSCENLQSEEIALQRQLKALQMEQSRLEKYRGILRTVLALKCSPETLKKVYHNLQLESRLQWLTKRQNTDMAAQPEYSLGE